ncbi:MAG: hypothetical protein IJ971_11560 [Bacteroidales bacterium]|nr:hypothetical protein [Bacteroidales bacterium]
MKKFLWIAAAVAGLLAVASCQKEGVDGGIKGEETVVTFSVETPEPATKIISDGEKVNVVHWAAFDNSGLPVAGLNGTAAITGKKATFNVKLVKHYTYRFVFWAHKGDQDGQHPAYDLKEFNTKGEVVVDYDGYANDDDRDAFYTHETITVASSNEVKTVYLYRPFAQINFLAADYTSVEAVGLHKDLKSTIFIKRGLPTVLHGLSGMVSGDAGTTLEYSAVPADPAYYEIEDAAGTKTTYGWYSMNYVLAADRKSEGNDNLEIYGMFKHSKSDQAIEVLVYNVPYRRNYRTNIIGNFLTEQAVMNIEVVPGFVDEDGDGQPDDFIHNYPEDNK